MLVTWHTANNEEGLWYAMMEGGCAGAEWRMSEVNMEGTAFKI